MSRAETLRDRLAHEQLMHVALRDVEAERRRQVEVEGWTTQHDDRHDSGEIARAAAAYAQAAGRSADDHKVNSCPTIWPWSVRWWKPTTRRQDLVKTAALAIAEIERLDRAALIAREGDDGR